MHAREYKSSFHRRGERMISTVRPAHGLLEVWFMKFVVIKIQLATLSCFVERDTRTHASLPMYSSMFRAGFGGEVATSSAPLASLSG